MSGDFNPEQERYLEGLVAGLQIAKAAREIAGASAAHLRAQDRVLAAGGKLSEQVFTRRHEIDALRSLIEGEMVG
jgi:ferredoxin-nitrite reductase